MAIRVRVSLDTASLLQNQGPSLYTATTIPMGTTISIPPTLLRLALLLPMLRASMATLMKESSAMFCPTTDDVQLINFLSL